MLLQKYFEQELEIWDLKDYYLDNYNNHVLTPAPPYPKGMADNYFSAGISFFDNFSIDMSQYEVIYIETTIDSIYRGITLVTKPDLVLKEKSTGNYILIDYKSSKIKDGKIKSEYRKQMLLYSAFLFFDRDIEISEIRIWHIRDNKILVMKIDPFEVQDVLDWFENIVNRIKSETEWKPNLSKANKYMCDVLCSVRESCLYRNPK